MTASPQERRKRLKDRGFQFPFVEKHYGRKHIPLKMVLSYEVSALFCGREVVILDLCQGTMNAGWHVVLLPKHHSEMNPLLCCYTG